MLISGIEEKGEKPGKEDSSAGQTLKKIFHQEDRIRKIEEQTTNVSMLMSPQRLSIFIHLHENPCDHTRSIARAMNKSLNSVNWNLGQLSTSELLVTSDLNGRKIYWPSDLVASEDLELISLLRSSWFLPIIKTVQQANGTARQKDVIANLKASQQNVNVWLGKLVTHHVLEAVADGTWKNYRISENFKSKIIEYGKLAKPYSRGVILTLKREGLMPRNARLRGTRLAVDIKLPAGNRRILIECSPLARSKLPAPKVTGVSSQAGSLQM